MRAVIIISNYHIVWQPYISSSREAMNEPLLDSNEIKTYITSLIYPPGIYHIWLMHAVLIILSLNTIRYVCILLNLLFLCFFSFQGGLCWPKSCSPSFSWQRCWAPAWWRHCGSSPVWHRGRRNLGQRPRGRISSCCRLGSFAPLWEVSILKYNKYNTTQRNEKPGAKTKRENIIMLQTWFICTTVGRKYCKSTNFDGYKIWRFSK